MLNYNLKSNRNGFFNIGLYQVVNQRKLFRLDTWRPSSLSELTPIIFNTGLTQLGSDASYYNQTNLSLCFSFLFKENNHIQLILVKSHYVLSWPSK